jgi:hypothetical protein
MRLVERRVASKRLGTVAVLLPLLTFVLWIAYNIF